jgi:hypothetical protein
METIRQGGDIVGGGRSSIGTLKAVVAAIRRRRLLGRHAVSAGRHDIAKPCPEISDAVRDDVQRSRFVAQ